MKFLFLMVFPVFVLAQVPGHLAADTTSKKRIRINGKSWAEHCFNQAASKKDSSLQYDGALNDCIVELHQADVKIGAASCWKIARAVANGDVKQDILGKCENHYGYENCAGSKPNINQVKNCIMNHSSSLTVAACKGILNRYKLSQDKGLMLKCLRGSTPYVQPLNEPTDDAAKQ